MKGTSRVEQWPCQKKSYCRVKFLYWPRSALKNTLSLSGPIPTRSTQSAMPWSDKIEEKIKELYKAFDADGSGSLSWAEFETKLRAMDVRTSLLRACWQVVASPAFVCPAVACIWLLPCDTTGSGAVGRGLQPEDAVVVFARSCGSVCNKPHTHGRWAGWTVRRRIDEEKI